MDFLLEDILDGVVHQLQEKVAPRVQQTAQTASQRLREAAPIVKSTLVSATKSRIRPLLPRSPPSNTDLLYIITDRLLISSQPALAAAAAHSTFEDTGRDLTAAEVSRKRGARNISSSQDKQQESTSENQPVTAEESPQIIIQNDGDAGGGGAAKETSGEPPTNPTQPETAEPVGRDKDGDRASSDATPPSQPLNQESESESTTERIPREEEGGESSQQENGDDAKIGVENPQDGTESNRDEIDNNETGVAASLPVHPSSQEEGANTIGNVEDDANNNSSESSSGEEVASSASGPNPNPSIEETVPPVPEVDDPPDDNGVNSGAMESSPETLNTSQESENDHTTGVTANNAAPLLSESATTNDGCDSNEHSGAQQSLPIIETVDPEQTGSSSHEANPSTTEMTATTDASSPPATNKLATDHDDALGGDDKSDEGDNHTGQLSASTTSLTSNKEQRIVNNTCNLNDQTDSKSSAHTHHGHPSTPRRRPDGRIMNSPGDMVTYLDNRHGKHHYLAFSLLNEPPDDRSLLLFRRQIVQLGWWSACLDRSALPSIPRILKACYAIRAYLQLDPANVALVYCENGRSRSGVVAACYLKFAGLVNTTEQGFLHFLSKTNPNIEADTILRKTPPSLRRFFHQFDEILEHGGFLNRKPLLLKAIALQGLPVEDEPCIDIWDSSKRHIFSSHPEMWQDDSYLQQQSSLFNGHNRPVSKWLDEDGFYKVNILLDGDFLLLCRFGGDFAHETSVHDPTKILFRYANNTGCLSGGRPYELDFEEVDVTKRYIDHLEDDFLVTLLFQADWEIVDEGDDSDLPPSILESLQRNSKRCTERARNCNDKGSLVEGWKVISESHSARPSVIDRKAFYRFCDGQEKDGLSQMTIALALQLTNFDFTAAKSLLSQAYFRDTLEPKPAKEDRSDTRTVKMREMEEKSSDSILTIMGQVNDASALAKPDRDLLDLSTNNNFNVAMDSAVLGSRTVMKSVVSPERGDIIGSFPSRGRATPIASPRSNSSSDSTSIASPKMPYFSPSKREIPPSSRALAQSDETGSSPRSNFPVYDTKARAVNEVQAQLSHTGIKSDRLIDLQEQSQAWTDVSVHEAEDEEDEDPSPPEEPAQEAIADRPRGSSMNREAKEKKEKKWIDDQKVEEEQKRKASHERKLSQEKMKEENELLTPTQEEPLKTDPEYAKYFKMLKIGMQKEQVMHAMKKDGKDPSILDLDPTKPLQAQLPKPDENADGPPLKDDPDYAKYFKMIKMGMPREQVLHAMKRDEKDPAVLDFDPSKSLKSQQKSDDSPALRDDPEYAKYFKMLAMKLPMGAVKNALVRDGKDPSIMDLDPSKSVKSQLTEKAPPEDTGPALKDDPEYSKYFKMLSMKLPMGAVKNALVRDGKDPSIMDLDPNKSVKSQLGDEKEEKDAGIPLKDDPEFAKYFKMEKMGLPRDAVKNALVRDGKDPGIIELDPNKSVAFQMKPTKSTVATKKSAKKKKKVRRKKIYWNPIDPGKIKEDSMWNIVRDYVAMDKLNYDQKEFEELFTESADPSDQKKKKTPQKEVKKLVQVIDPKRSMNGGIVLARMKTDHKKIAEYVDRMEHGKFDSTQLKALKEYLADPDERRGLIAYMRKGEKSEEINQKLFADLSETEKYMVTLMEVEDAGVKLEAMLFRSVFTNRFHDITDAVRTLNSACDELRSSERLRKLMAVILTVVNQINTGGEGSKAMGFTLDALLKLNEAKAFDKKTSVLHYVVKLVKKNDESLLMFETDVSHVIPAGSVLLDGVAADVKAIRQELDGVLDIVKQDAERLEEAGSLRKMSLAELVEQKTMVHHVGVVPQFNKISHLTGRTSMERFTLNAKVACGQVEESIVNVQKKYATVLGYFGENENMATGDFFGILRRFMAEWKKAVEQVDKIDRAQAKEKKRAAARAAKEAKKGQRRGVAKPAKEKKPPTRGDIAALAAKAATKRDARIEKADAAFKKPPPPGGIAALAAAAALKKSQAKTESSEKNEKHNSAPPGGIAALAAAAALKKSQQKADSSGESTKQPTKPPPPGGIATLAAEAALKKSQLKSQNEGQENTSPGGIAALAAAAARKKQTESNTEEPKAGGIAALAAAAARKKQTDSSNDDAKAAAVSTIVESHGDGSSEPASPDATSGVDEKGDKQASAKNTSSDPNTAEHTVDEPRSPSRKDSSKFLSSLSAYRKNKSKSHRKLDAGDGASSKTDQQDAAEHTASQETPQLTSKGDKEGPASTENQTKNMAPAELLDSTATTTNSETNRTDSERKGPPSLGSFLEQQQQQQPPSLGSFLEQRNSHEYRAEVLRYNSDDSSVAIMAENFEKDAVTSSDWDDTGNEGGGISDFMGWANLAINASDTESVRGFEHSHNLDYQNYDDDDSTIATAYYDDDASIVSGMATPRGNVDNSYFDDYQTTENFVDNVPSVTAKVAASILFNDSETEESSVDQNKKSATNGNNPYGDCGGQPTKDSDLIDTALSFNDVGLDAGLSFGGDVGFDDGLGGFGGHAMNDLGPVGFDAGGGGDFGGHQPFTNSNNESRSPKEEEKAEEKKAPTTASKSWFGGWGGK